MSRLSKWFGPVRVARRREEGQTMAEYSLVIAVITVGAVAALTSFSGGVMGAIQRAINLIPK